MTEKNEFVYSVSDLFNKVLKEEGLEKFYIGPYQRGYKWDSTSYYDQVPQLLLDIYNAMRKNQRTDERIDDEYYLQYITVLKNIEKKAFEVIDGQQRITTLAILFDRISRFNHNLSSVANDKIEYSRDESSMGLFEKLNEISNNDEIEDTQDNYYIIGAVKCIDDFIIKLDNHFLLEKYYNYLCDSVKIILNRESEFVTPEEVFVNLNGNSVELTNSYLIKGLFLTHSVNRTDSFGNTLLYSDILEQRKINGRKWDEIQNWINSYEINYFFFGNESASKKNGMENFLELALLIYNSDEEDTQQEDLIEEFKTYFYNRNTNWNYEGSFRLFNKYNELVRTDEDGLKWMNRIVHMYQKLRSIYESIPLANLLGLILFRKKSKRKLTAKERLLDIKPLISQSERDIKKSLAVKALNMIPDVTETSLSYPNESLTPLLLSLSVFPEGLSIEPRFNFIEYDEMNWTYEHIRPQNPKDSLRLPDYARSTVEEMFIRAMKEEKLNKIQEYFRKRETSEGADDLAGPIPTLELDENEKNILEQIKSGEIQDVNDVDFLYAPLSDDELNSMGNMALLSSSVNSSISNNPYIIKRNEIYKKLEEGYFIPQHTIAVFGKAMNVQGKTDKSFSIDQLNWDSKDIEAHEAWIMSRNKEIRENLKKMLK